MFHSLTRKLTSAARPVRISGVALTSVSANPNVDANDARTITR